jgi:hypothetical protein
MDPSTIDLARNLKDNSETNVHAFTGDTIASERRTSLLQAVVGGRHKPDGKENGARSCGREPQTRQKFLRAEERPSGEGSSLAVAFHPMDIQ